MVSLCVLLLRFWMKFLGLLVCLLGVRYIPFSALPVGIFFFCLPFYCQEIEWFNCVMPGLRCHRPFKFPSPMMRKVFC